MESLSLTTATWFVLAVPMPLTVVLSIINLIVRAGRKSK